MKADKAKKEFLEKKFSSHFSVDEIFTNVPFSHGTFGTVIKNNI